MPTFAEQLKAIRKERNITQDKLSKEMGVARQTISHWENGRVIPDIDTIKHLSRVLNYNFFAVEGIVEESQSTPEPEEIPAQETAVQQRSTASRGKRFVLPAALGGCPAVRRCDRLSPDERQAVRCPRCFL